MPVEQKQLTFMGFCTLPSVNISLHTYSPPVKRLRSDCGVYYQCNVLECTVEPLNKGHFGNNINSAVVSKRGCPFLRGSKCIKTIGKPIIRDLEKCPLQRGLIYYVPISEGPLLEVLLYMLDQYVWYTVMKQHAYAHNNTANCVARLV